MARTKPYTKAGIVRLKCCVKDCKQRAFTQWQICADGRIYRPVCVDHDVQINRIVLELMGVPDIEARMAAYEESLVLRR